MLATANSICPPAGLCQRRAIRSETVVAVLASSGLTSDDSCLGNTVLGGSPDPNPAPSTAVGAPPVARGIDNRPTRRLKSSQDSLCLFAFVAGTGNSNHLATLASGIHQCSFCAVGANPRMANVLPAPSWPALLSDEDRPSTARTWTQIVANWAERRKLPGRTGNKVAVQGHRSKRVPTAWKAPVNLRASACKGVGVRVPPPTRGQEVQFRGHFRWLRGWPFCCPGPAQFGLSRVIARPILWGRRRSGSVPVGRLLRASGRVNVPGCSGGLSGPPPGWCHRVGRLPLWRRLSSGGRRRMER